MACAIRVKYTRTHYNGSAALPESVKGAKELKKYNTELTTLLAKIHSMFEEDLYDAKSRCAQVRICLKNHDFRNEMCEVAHNDFVYAATKLPQSSAYIQAQQAAQECLEQLELVRKMMVTNKQQKKTTVRKLRTIIAREKKSQLMLPALVVDKNASIIAKHLESVAIDDESPTVKNLRSMISQTKQNHCTVAKNLLKQAAVLMDAMRNQHILTYNTAAESTIGAIITHASSCSAFMRQTLNLEKPTLQHKPKSTSISNPNNYYVTVEVNSGLHAKFNAWPHDIRVVVYGDSVLNATDEKYEPRILYSYVFDNLLAETILTDEAIEAFEKAQANLK